jgi:hypothetical protein
MMSFGLRVQAVGESAKAGNAHQQQRTPKQGTETSSKAMRAGNERLTTRQQRRDALPATVSAGTRSNTSTFEPSVTEIVNRPVLPDVVWWERTSSRAISTSQ